MLKLEEEDDYALRILDFRVQKLCGKLAYAPFLKPNFPVYITETSGHGRHIHESWPIANLSRVCALASKRALMLDAKETLLLRYRDAGVAESVRARAQKVDPFKEEPRIVGLPEVGVRSSDSSVEPPKEVWGSLRYHPVLGQAALHSVGVKTFEKWQHHTRSPLVLPRVAWRNYGPPLVHVLRRGFFQGGARGR